MLFLLAGWPGGRGRWVGGSGRVCVWEVVRGRSPAVGDRPKEWPEGQDRSYFYIGLKFNDDVVKKARPLGGGGGGGV